MKIKIKSIDNQVVIVGKINSIDPIAKEVEGYNNNLIGPPGLGALGGLTLQGAPRIRVASLAASNCCTPLPVTQAQNTGIGKITLKIKTALKTIFYYCFLFIF